MEGDTRATVLVVDDDRRIAESHAERLENYDTETAFDGTAALSAMDETVDVVLLDRRMPGLNGKEVLEQIREQEYDCQVAMLTGVEPELDIIDMGFDEYLKKPVSGDELRETVEALCQRSRYDARLQRYFSLSSKVAALKAEHDHEELARKETYVELREKLSRLRDEVDASLSQLSTRDSYAVAADTRSRS
ncbi:hypothetical protein BRD04_08015 [Halobacteriales archaeon QS_9_67_17]|nr:MAG: hypothetical protein BRD04_08015 [Halobacteriales archaeon QS_9_67_17]